MMKNILAYALLLVVVAGCKKDNSAKQLDIAGTWKMTSFNQGGISVTSAEYSCLENNIITFSTNGTAAGQYKGSNSCSIAYGTGGTVIVGSPGDGSSQITWTRSGNNIVIREPGQFGTPLTFYGILSTVNNQLTLKITDTVFVGNSPVISSQTDVKQ